MTGLLAFPFRFASTGQVATVRDGSDEEVHQLLAMALLVRVGERMLNPLYGIPDPVFTGIDVSDLQACVNMFGPAGIQVQDITPRATRETTKALIRVGWERED